MANKFNRLSKPEWLKIKLSAGEEYKKVDEILKSNSLHTICSSGLCPNKMECWNRGTATFMILGDVCTRSCGFCATKTGTPAMPQPGEPEEIADSVYKLALKHCVITSVTRDDLEDGGAAHWASVIRECKRVNPNVTIEVLIPDFKADKRLLDIVLNEEPHIVAHNIETVRRLTPLVRSGATYDVSLSTLNYISKTGARTKSGFMTGLGERDEEITETFKDLLDNGCSIVTVGQYLQPTTTNLPVVEYITPQRFEEYQKLALSMGFSHAVCGPLVRSSYMSESALKL